MVDSFSGFMVSVRLGPWESPWTWFRDVSDDDAVPSWQEGEFVGVDQSSAQQFEALTLGQLDRERSFIVGWLAA